MFTLIYGVAEGQLTHFKYDGKQIKLKYYFNTAKNGHLFDISFRIFVTSRLKKMLDLKNYLLMLTVYINATMKTMEKARCTLPPPPAPHKKPQELSDRVVETDVVTQLQSIVLETLLGQLDHST